MLFWRHLCSIAFNSSQPRSQTCVNKPADHSSLQLSPARCPSHWGLPTWGLRYRGVEVSQPTLCPVCPDSQILFASWNSCCLVPTFGVVGYTAARLLWGFNELRDLNWKEVLKFRDFQPLSSLGVETTEEIFLLKKWFDKIARILILRVACPTYLLH